MPTHAHARIKLDRYPSPSVLFFFEGVIDNVGDEDTFFYVIRHWTGDDGNPVDMDSDEEWETIEGAREYVKACPKEETACIVEARHVVKEVYHG